jgi:asparagine synthase (glutamine-hydrolysing)
MLAPGRARAAVGRAITALSTRHRVGQRLSRTFLAIPADFTSLYFDNFAVFSRARQAVLLSAETRARLGDIDPYAAGRRALAETDAHTPLDRLLAIDTRTYLHELLMKQDQMSMAASIESRVPFLDHPLVEFASRLPEHLKLRGLTTKRVLREAMKGDLPAPILSRRKMGFPVPVGAWLRGPYRRLLDEFVVGPRARARGWFDPVAVRTLVESHCQGTQSHDARLWSIINFEIWQRVFLDGEPVESVRGALR